MRKAKSHHYMPASTSTSLADYMLEQSINKWKAPPPAHVTNIERYRNMQDGQGAIDFMHEVLGLYLRPYQEEIVRDLIRYKRVVVRAPRGAGKSAMAAGLILWFTAVHPECKVPTTAGSWAQLQNFLWPEIHLWHKRADWTLIGKRPLVNQFELKFFENPDPKMAVGEQATQFAFAFKSDQPELMEGAHSPAVLLVIDEAKAVPDATFDALEATISRGDKYALVISTPGPPNGRFYALCTQSSGFEHWHPYHITLPQVAEAIRDPEEREQYRTNCEQFKKAHGEDSALYRNYILAEFGDMGDQQVIPLAWIQAAVRRWKAWSEAGFPDTWPGVLDGWKGLGADLAGQGKDQSCVAFRIGCGIREMKYFAKMELMQTVNWIMALASEWRGLRVEADAIGAGPVSRIREILDDDRSTAEDERAERKYKNVVLQAIVSGSRDPEARDASGELSFYNKRSEMWWKFRERLDPSSGQDIMLPPDPLLMQDLTSPAWELREGGKIFVESKRDVAKRIKRSTDSADAVILAFCDDSAPLVYERISVSAAPNAGPRRSFWETSRQWPGYSGRKSWGAF